MEALIAITAIAVAAAGLGNLLDFEPLKFAGVMAAMLATAIVF